MKWAALMAAALVATYGCGHTKAAAPAIPTTLVATSALSASLTATATGRAATVPPVDLARLAPLLAARTFTSPEPLADYGLDHPQALLTYRLAGGGTETLEIGATDFDAHGFYVRRPGDPSVYVVLSDALGPALALVGVAVPTPG